MLRLTSQLTARGTTALAHRAGLPLPSPPLGRCLGTAKLPPRGQGQALRGVQHRTTAKAKVRGHKPPTAGPSGGNSAKYRAKRRLALSMKRDEVVDEIASVPPPATRSAPETPARAVHPRPSRHTAPQHATRGSRLRTASVEELDAVVADALGPGRSMAAEDVTTAMGVYGRNGRLDKALELMDVLPQLGLAMQPQHFSALVRACTHLDRLSLAHKLLAVMDERDLAVDNHYLAAHLEAARAEGAWQRALQLLDQHGPRVKGGVTDAHLATVLEVCGNAGLWRKTLELHKRLPEKHGVVRTEQSYRAALLACTRNNRPAEACAVLEQMLGQQLPPSRLMFSLVRGAVLKTKRADVGVRLLNLQRAAEVEWKQGEYAFAVWALSNNNQHDEALDVFERTFADSGLSPDVRLCNEVLQAYARAGGKVKSVIGLVSDYMPSRNVKPDRMTYHLSVPLLARSGHTRKAVRLYESMVADDIKPSPHTARTLIDACRKSGFTKRAQSLYYELLELGVDPDIFLVNAMLRVCGAAEAAEQALKVYEQAVVHFQLQPNGGTFDALLVTLIEVGQVDLAQVMYLEHMPSYGLSLDDLHSHGAKHKMLGVSGDWQRAVELVRGYVHNGNPVPVELFHAAMIACRTAKAGGEALRLFRRMLEVGCNSQTNYDSNSELITASIVLEALEASGMLDHADVFYAMALALGNFKDRESKMWLDLHGHTRLVARVALRHALLDMSRYAPTAAVGLSSRMSVVTGKGLHSENMQPVLHPLMRKFVAEELGPPLRVEEVEFNSGMFVVPMHAIGEWAPTWQQRRTLADLDKALEEVNAVFTLLAPDTPQQQLFRDVPPVLVSLRPLEEHEDLPALRAALDLCGPALDPGQLLPLPPEPPVTDPKEEEERRNLFAAGIRRVVELAKGKATQQHSDPRHYKLG